jgi:nicotinamide mononucleotide adenylyltransferase
MTALPSRNARTCDFLVFIGRFQPLHLDHKAVIDRALEIEIPGAEQLAEVCASDDAEQAFWTPIADLDPQTMFEDHWDIVQELMHEPTAEGGLRG